jgi:hypothetical protein
MLEIQEFASENINQNQINFMTLDPHVATWKQPVCTLASVCEIKGTSV